MFNRENRTGRVPGLLLVSQMMQEADDCGGCQAIYPKQVPAVAFEPFAEPFEGEEPGGEGAYHADEAGHHRGRQI